MRKLIILACVLLPLASHGQNSAVKYHPGHYIAFSAGEDIKAVDAVKDSAVTGVNKRYYWAKMEPSKGKYDFSEIEKDLAYLAKHNKQLVVFITDKTFSGKDPDPLPAYVRPHGVVNDKGGVTAKKWDPVIIEREVALCAALSKAFDNHPCFEGIAYQESAPSVAGNKLHEMGYTPELMRDGLIALLTGSSKAFPRSQVFWYMNFLPMNNDYLDDVAKACVPYRVVMGGPDILPYRDALIKHYPIYDRFNGKLKLFCSAQNDSYCHHKDDRNNNTKDVYHSAQKPIHPDGYVTMEEIFRFGRDRLHLNYIFWNYKTYRGKSYPGDPQAFVFDDALKVIRANPRFNQ